MDLGATVCTRHKPLCASCPLAPSCFALRTGRQHEFPAPRPARARPTRKIFMVVAVRNDGSVLLERRPESGIWGGLWCLPEFDTACAAGGYIRQQLCDAAPQPQALRALEHAFTHFDLVITPMLASCGGTAGVMDAARTVWYNAREPAPLGLPAPIKLLLEELTCPGWFSVQS
jgi:A/G-specific adenine glycosylase